MVTLTEMKQFLCQQLQLMDVIVLYLNVVLNGLMYDLFKTIK